MSKGQEEKTKLPLSPPSSESVSWLDIFLKIFPEPIRLALAKSINVARRSKGAFVALIIIAVALWMWWNWPAIQQRPFVNRLIAWITRTPIPHIVPGKFAIAVTQLENDPQHNMEGIITDTLERFPVQRISIDRTIPSSGGNSQVTILEGQKMAHELLKKSGADLLIWGRVVTDGTIKKLTLYWTPARDLPARARGSYMLDNKLDLPREFRAQLTDVLRLLIVTRAAEFSGHQGHYVADKLAPFIGPVRQLLANPIGWDQDTDTSVRFVFATALLTYGEQSGKNEPLLEALGLYRFVLQQYSRDKVPLEWALTQNKIGNVLLTLGERESGTRHLEEAVQAYRQALQERTRDKVPLDWAWTQNNLGIALDDLGRREPGTRHLEEAVQAYRQALQERTRDKVPLDWGITKATSALRSMTSADASQVPGISRKPSRPTVKPSGSAPAIRSPSIGLRPKTTSASRSTTSADASQAPGISRKPSRPIGQRLWYFVRRGRNTT